MYEAAKMVSFAMCVSMVGSSGTLEKSKNVQSRMFRARMFRAELLVYGAGTQDVITGRVK